MLFNNKNEKIDTARLNEILKVAHHVLKAIFVLVVISLIVLGTYLINSWKILSFVKMLLIVISPIFIGLAIAWLLDPLVTWLHEKKINRIVASAVIYLIFIGIIYILIRLIVPIFIDQINDFIASIPDILNYVKTFISNCLDSISKKSMYDLSAVKRQIFQTIESVGINLTTNLPLTLVNIGKTILNGGVTLVLGFLLGFYLLIDFRNVGGHLLDIIPKRWHTDFKELISKLNRSLRSFVQGTLLIMLLVFVAQSIGLTLAGLKSPMLFGAFCAVTNVIPYLGPYIGGIPAVIIGFSISPLTGIFTLCSIVIVQVIESYFLQPIVMGKAMKLHPVTILVGLLIFQHFFGILGMILATPVIASAKIIFSFIDSKLHFKSMIQKEMSEEKTS